MAEVVFIGTSDAFCSGGRRNSAILVRDRDLTLLLDCGPTTLGGLKQLGIDPLEIDAIALSHFHGDHTAGVPFLTLEYVYERPREKPLYILGPPGTRARLDAMHELFVYNSEIPQRYETRYLEFEAGHSMRVEDVEVVPYRAQHHAETVPHMFRIGFRDRSLFFTGDTGWHDALPERVGDVDLLISECSLLEDRFDFHLSYETLDRTRDKFRCARTVLTHLGEEVLENLDRVHFDPAYDGLKLQI